MTKTFYFFKNGVLILFFVSNSFFKGVGGYPITTPINPPNPKEALFKRLSLADESFLILILKMPLIYF
ncbi:hypothetical protein ECC16_04020 [Helicobacter pylori]|nr:hypothetical protein ECC16_04020 [Helicobacter pylori]RVZ17765.1 hypothetical protein EC534_04020 [Helicobacter pylori]